MFQKYINIVSKKHKKQNAIRKSYQKIWNRFSDNWNYKIIAQKNKDFCKRNLETVFDNET